MGLNYYLIGEDKYRQLMVRYVYRNYTVLTGTVWVCPCGAILHPVVSQRDLIQEL